MLETPSTNRLIHQPSITMSWLGVMHFPTVIWLNASAAASRNSTRRSRTPSNTNPASKLPIFFNFVLWRIKQQMLICIYIYMIGRTIVENRTQEERLETKANKPFLLKRQWSHKLLSVVRMWADSRWLAMARCKRITARTESKRMSSLGRTRPKTSYQTLAKAAICQILQM